MCRTLLQQPTTFLANGDQLNLKSRNIQIKRSVFNATDIQPMHRNFVLAHAATLKPHQNSM